MVGFASRIITTFRISRCHRSVFRNCQQSICSSRAAGEDRRTGCLQILNHIYWGCWSSQLPLQRPRQTRRILKLSMNARMWRLNLEEEQPSKRRKVNSGESTALPHIQVFDVAHQEVLWLHAPKQRYALAKEQPIPNLDDDHEMLVAVEAIGLNPIDWKAPYVDIALVANLTNTTFQRFRMGSSKTPSDSRSRPCWTSRPGPQGKVSVQSRRSSHVGLDRL